MKIWLTPNPAAMPKVVHFFSGDAIVFTFMYCIYANKFTVTVVVWQEYDMQTSTENQLYEIQDDFLLKKKKNSRVCSVGNHFKES